MARITKTAAAASVPAATSGKAAGKVAKLDKTAAAAAKPEKAAAEPKPEKAPRKSQWHGLKIARTEAGKAEAPARNGALIRFNAIVAHKSTSDAIGSEYTDTDGTVKKITPADIAYLVKRELITAE